MHACMHAMGELNCELAIIVISCHTLKTPNNYPYIRTCIRTDSEKNKEQREKKQTNPPTKDAGQRCDEKTKKVEIYSLGSSKALTQFLYQRLRLPFFGDVGE